MNSASENSNPSTENFTNPTETDTTTSPATVVPVEAHDSSNQGSSHSQSQSQSQNGGGNQSQSQSQSQNAKVGMFKDYTEDQFFDEMFDEHGQPRPMYRGVFDQLSTMSPDDFMVRRRRADLTLLHQGITFTVYDDDNNNTERVWPVDLVPRIVTAEDWAPIEAGLKQRIHALNLFVHDVYHDQKILKDGILPADLVLGSADYRREIFGATVAKDTYIHITGTDLIRDAKGVWYILEDNLRCPSGVSYVMENRQVMKNAFPMTFERYGVRSVDGYALDLREALRKVAPNGVENPTIVLLTPGIYNSAYFEHTFLAKQMGVELCEGRDLIVDDAHVYMRTTQGLRRVDVIYRRVDDEWLDPLTFRSDSGLGVPGLVNAWRAGNVTLANAIGTGVADDKAIYSFTPQIIKYYLGEEPLLPIVPTYWPAREDDRKYVLEHLHELFVKPTNASGGYGMLAGPFSTQAERDSMRDQILDNPRGFIAQPTIALSRHPSYIDEGDGHFEGRHIDLRPFIIYDPDDIKVLPGGLTRVAMRKGSLVVNSSQGGGSKDTWVLSE